MGGGKLASQPRWNSGNGYNSLHRRIISVVEMPFV